MAMVRVGRKPKMQGQQEQPEGHSGGLLGQIKGRLKQSSTGGEAEGGMVRPKRRTRSLERIRERLTQRRGY
jgi:hypothetical protein